MLGVLDTAEARKIAVERGLDLVEVSPDAAPPVCKFIDYGKYKYQQSKKDHEKQKKAHVTKLKELRLRPITEKHDIDVKMRHAREFLQHGDKVLITMVFRGREMAHTQFGRENMARIVKNLEDIAKVENPLRMMGTRMSVQLMPKVGAPPSKAASGAAKPAAKPAAPPPPAAAAPAPVAPAPAAAATEPTEAKASPTTS